MEVGSAAGPRREPLLILVAALARLQDVTGRSGGFDFPRIVVVGNQSAGKSSILEAIVGKEFLPRGNDIVTRCPLYVRLHQTTAGSEEKAVFVAEKQYNLEEASFTDFAKVCREIERRTEKRVGNSKNVNHDEICLDIYSPNYPDLQFVDLPGFTKISVEGQPDDIEQQILSMNLKYMKDPKTIILAIQDATQDIGASEALKHALSREVDPAGKRTVGILTKLDKVERGTDTDRVINVLENKTKPLSMGYIGVVNRSQNQIDRNVDVGTAQKSETQLLDRPEFSKIKHKMGIDYLRRFLTTMLAQKMKKMMPTLKKERSEEHQAIVEQLINVGYAADEKVDYDDLIAELVEKTIDRVRIALQGMDSDVNTKEKGLGAKINEQVKEGTIVSSKEARKTYSVESFYSELKTGIQNSHAIRDHILPVEIALEIGVGILTECYRRPFFNLLNNSTELITVNIRTIVEDTLKAYPKFQDLVTDTLLDELDLNKTKAEDYLGMIIDIHKRFVNSEHVEFQKLRNLREGGIRYKNNFNIWFVEEIPTDSEGKSKRLDSTTLRPTDFIFGQQTVPDRLWGKVTNGEDSEDASTDVVATVMDVAQETIEAVLPSYLNIGIKGVRGFVERIQKGDPNVHTNKLPSKREEEAMLHLDLCLEYMEIVDKQLVDEIPKIIIMMLVHKMLDFLKGGRSYRTSILREVQKKCRDVDMKVDVLTKSHGHEEMIADLLERKRICEETIKVIDETSSQLDVCT